jgi:hypothetical protein
MTANKFLRSELKKLVPRELFLRSPERLEEFLMWLQTEMRSQDAAIHRDRWSYHDLPWDLRVEKTCRRLLREEHGARIRPILQ